MNNIITSKMTQVLSLEMAKNAGFLKRGAKDYFSDQINGKMRAGQEYDFVLPDSGNVQDGLVASPRDIDERKVSLKIQNKNNSVRLDALESVTDVKWEEEIASQYAGKLMNKIVSEAVNEASTKATAAFAGRGFQALAKAGAHVQSITTEKVFGFCDPQMQAVLAANGQQFVPAGNPNDLYGKGRLGTFQGVEYDSERFLKPVTVGASLEGAKVNGNLSETVTSGSCSLSIDGISGTGVIKAGTPIWVNGVYACDTVGDETSVPYAFIVKEDADVTSSAATVKVDPFVFSDIGARSISTSATDNLDITSLEAGKTYYRAIVRADGAYCYSPVNSMDFDLSDKRTAGDTDGIKVFCNGFTDGTSAVNMVRWDAPYMAGTVEPRCVAVAYTEA